MELQHSFRNTLSILNLTVVRDKVTLIVGTSSSLVCFSVIGDPFLLRGAQRKPPFR